MRITKKREDGFYELKKGEEIYGEENGIRLVQIVGQLEDIKDELGVDLVVLFKALKNGCFAKETFMYMGKVITQIIFTKFTYLYYDDNTGVYFIHIRNENHYIENYGKTWALTKEELL